MSPFFSTPQRIETLLSVARSWLGTPFYPHGRVKGAGVSCQTLPECIYHETGALPQDIVTPRGSLRHYRSNRESLIARFVDEKLSDYLEPVARCDVQPGDLLLHFFRVCEHGGIALNGAEFIHAGLDGVTIQRRDDAAFMAALARVWRPICRE